MRNGIDISALVRDVERRGLDLPEEIAQLLAENWRDDVLIDAQTAAKKTDDALQAGRDRLAKAHAAELAGADDDDALAAAGLLIRRAEIALAPLEKAAAQARDALTAAEAGSRSRERAWREAQATTAAPLLAKLHEKAERAMADAAERIWLHDNAERLINHRFSIRDF